jgi:hypothetical protein
MKDEFLNQVLIGVLISAVFALSLSGLLYWMLT